MPIGVPITMPSTVKMIEPMIGFRSPPALPGGGVISVKTESESPAKPCQEERAEDDNQPGETESGRSKTKGHGDRVRAASAGEAGFHGSVPLPAFHLHEHVARRGKHDEGDDEEDEAKGNQRRGVEVTDRLGEFVGDRRGNRGAGLQDRG